ncbi:MAG: hypothetical protein QOC71_928 [Thermoplasmata archaeon]|jgi:hypothetical protein|nr:hypothetical protein [Thermoplasmata archaeon]
MATSRQGSSRSDDSNERSGKGGSQRSGEERGQGAGAQGTQQERDQQGQGKAQQGGRSQGSQQSQGSQRNEQGRFESGNQPARSGSQTQTGGKARRGTEEEE